MCTTFIRRFVFNLPQGKIFTTRDCLGFGLRNSVDVALHRLVGLEIIIRLARGVFVRNDSDARTITARQVATEKAKAFGKEIIVHDSDAAKEVGLIQGAPSSLSFCVNGGHSSSFRFRLWTIRLKGTSMKRMRLGESKAGKSARALWHLGSKRFSLQHLECATLRLMRSDLDELRQSIRWMPAWLGDHFVNRRIRFGAI